MGVTLAAAAAGVLLGALLPIAVYRSSVPYGDPPLTSCEHCGRSLPWAGPVCPQCRRRLGPPWWATALGAGAACALLAAALGPVPELPLFGGLAVLGTALAAIDLACRRLPSSVVLPAFAAAAAGFVVVAAISGSWGALGRALIGAVALGVVYLALYLVPGGGLGFGDVQLAALLGLFLGYLGLSYVLWGAVLPWLVNAPVVLVLLMLRRVDRRSRLPFGPALLGGALLAVVIPGLLSAALS